jgi:hypothetical protein
VVFEDRIDDGPGGLCSFLAREQGAFSRKCVAQEALVRFGLVGVPAE